MLKCSRMSIFRGPERVQERWEFSKGQHSVWMRSRPQAGPPGQYEGSCHVTTAAGITTSPLVLSWQTAAH